MATMSYLRGMRSMIPLFLALLTAISLHAQSSSTTEMGVMTGLTDNMNETHIQGSWTVDHLIQGGDTIVRAMINVKHVRFDGETAFLFEDERAQWSYDITGGNLVFTTPHGRQDTYELTALDGDRMTWHQTLDGIDHNYIWSRDEDSEPTEDQNTFSNPFGW